MQDPVNPRPRLPHDGPLQRPLVRGRLTKRNGFLRIVPPTVTSRTW